MTIYEFTSMTGCSISICNRGDSYGVNDRWHASFNKIEVCDGGMLISYHGNGSTPQKAIADYLPKIIGKTITMDSGKTKSTMPKIEVEV